MADCYSLNLFADSYHPSISVSVISLERSGKYSISQWSYRPGAEKFWRVLHWQASQPDTSPSHSLWQLLCTCLFNLWSCALSFFVSLSLSVDSSSQVSNFSQPLKISQACSVALPKSLHLRAVRFHVFDLSILQFVWLIGNTFPELLAIRPTWHCHTRDITDRLQSQDFFTNDASSCSCNFYSTGIGPLTKALNPTLLQGGLSPA